jgi:hypothetical protein
MSFDFVLDLKLYIPVSRKLFISLLLTLVTLNPGALHADDYVHMIQYELLFGNKPPVSNLYISMHSGGMEQSLYGAGNQTVFRTPVVSTDPHKFTLLKPLSVLFASEESANDNENGSDDSAPEPSVGHAFGSLVGLVLILGPLVYAASSSISDINDIDVDVDIPKADEVYIPELPPETGS